MDLRVHNTLTHRIEPFEPREPGHVRMYVCGPSVYDESHLGHARSYVTYDAIKRYFLAKGLKVTHVQNFTDIEENIAARAKARGLAPLELANHLIGRFFEDMDALRILRADHYPRVSEHIAEIQTMVRGLEKKLRAYRYDCRPDAAGRSEAASAPSSLGCDVYFDAQTVRDYGALIGTSIEELAVELPMREQGDRRHPLDFALWKSRDDWGVTWKSPWGEGRPGWHVECAAMSTKYLGFDFDLHGGGLDLVFPHHENERVIGEAVSGSRYCRYYVHNGFVTVGSQKMSKSLGNFVTVKELLSKHEPDALRLFLLSAHYREALNYDERAMDAAQQRLERWREAARRALPGESPAREEFWNATEDDLHFERAMDVVDRAISDGAATRGLFDDVQNVIGVRL